MEEKNGNQRKMEVNGITCSTDADLFGSNRICRLKCMFDWFADSCLWPDNSEAHNRFGYGPLDPERLPLSDSLKKRITSLCDKYNQALDWGNPTNGLRWNMEQKNAFLEEARNISRLIQDELGSGYLIVEVF